MLPFERRVKNYFKKNDEEFILPNSVAKKHSEPFSFKIMLTLFRIVWIPTILSFSLAMTITILSF